MPAVGASVLATAVATHALLLPLALVSAGLSRYVAAPVFADAVFGLVSERWIKAASVDSVFIAGAIASGYYAAMALANDAYYNASRHRPASRRPQADSRCAFSPPRGRSGPSPCLTCPDKNYLVISWLAVHGGSLWHYV